METSFFLYLSRAGGRWYGLIASFILFLTNIQNHWKTEFNSIRIIRIIVNHKRIKECISISESSLFVHGHCTDSNHRIESGNDVCERIRE